MKIGKELKAMRENAGLSQSDVAREIGWTTPQLVSNFERSISLPPIDSLKQLSKIYKVDCDYLKQLIFEASVSSYRESLSKKLWP